MKKFLEETAAALYGEFGPGISDLNIVFPGKRARLYFNEFLLEESAGRPLWQPRYQSIDDLIRLLSGMTAGDHLRLMVELYRIYNEYHPESFDRFYSFGEMLLSDFDTVDKYLIDARALYANISDLREIEDRFTELFSGKDEALAMVLRFWRTFSRRTARSVEQQQFLKIWRSLYDIYERFRERLKELGIGYAGMLYREVAECLPGIDADERFDGKIYCFVGFNALNECEKRLFEYLQRIGSARFYWDYDNYFYKQKEQEAGRFIRRNIARFGDTEEGFEHENFIIDKEIEVITSPSDILQCKALYRKLEEIHRRQGYVGRETAVVLTDENLLLPVLHSIPPCVENINITMGYPLVSTVAYLMLERLLNLQARKRPEGFGQREVVELLSHPFVVERSPDAPALGREIETGQMLWVEPDFFTDPFLRSIFQNISGPEAIQTYLERVLSGFGSVESDTAERRERKEFLFTILEQIIRLGNTVRECRMELPETTYLSLLRQVLRKVRVPYEGEPLAGLQVMGILETRNLDFENVILLSVTDDSFPGNREGSSYIPFNLRQAFGLPTAQDHEAMYAYYFYRLISRCDLLTLMYSSAADDQRTGEQSRYIYQLEYESLHTVLRTGIDLKVEFKPVEALSQSKTPEVIDTILSREWTPTSVNRFIDCPLKFWFADVKRIRAEVVPGMEFSPLDLGNLLHEVMQDLYTPYTGLFPAAPYLGQIGDGTIRESVEKALKRVVGGRADLSPDGTWGLYRRVLTRYVRQLVDYDRQRAGDFRIVALEKKIGHTFVLGEKTLRLGGIADRIDEMADGTLRVVDYKSGGDTPEFRSLNALFTDEGVSRDGELKYEAHNSAALQAMLYALILAQSEKKPVRPALYVARRMALEDFTPYLSSKESDGEMVLAPNETQFLKGLLETLFSALTDPAIPFTGAVYDNKCKWCDYARICRRWQG